MFKDIFLRKMQKRYTTDVKDNTIDGIRTLIFCCFLVRISKIRTDRADGINEIKSPDNHGENRDSRLIFGNEQIPHLFLIQYAYKNQATD